MLTAGSIGIFDSGYGGLSVLTEVQKKLPQYDYVYLGDNSRSPYGARSFEQIYEFTLQGVQKLFEKGCNLILIACNTASAKALRQIQQNDLPKISSEKRILGIIRPTVEIIYKLSQTGHIGILGTEGTIKSKAYEVEIHKIDPSLVVVGNPCPMWVPLVENLEAINPGADYFVKKYIDQILAKDSQIDTLILACTHYPMLYPKIKEYVPKHINIISQGKYIALSLERYLERHLNIKESLTQNEKTIYLTTEDAEKFSTMASVLIGKDIIAERVMLE